MKLLMVCLGNICRSPMAEGIMKQKIKQNGLPWQVDSAGTNGYHAGEPPHRLSQKVAAMHGIDISKQKARDLVPEDFEIFDHIYAMAGDVISEVQFIAGKKFDSEKISLLMDEVHPGKNRDVPDPWYGPEAGYHQVFEMIDKACDKIISNHTVQKQNNINTP
ncbi:MAG TPA: low molecular weight protein-tyrosine-phosphatase [Agriterribacter sp.]|nr:low molecular weight protein-tyrosine-phosphatase [Agriterribacter sp.]